MKAKCRRCRGKGLLYNINTKLCRKCKGTGWVIMKEMQFSITIMAEGVGEFDSVETLREALESGFELRLRSSLGEFTVTSEEIMELEIEGEEEE